MEFDCMTSFGVKPWSGAVIRDESGADAAIKYGATLIALQQLQRYP